MIYVYYSAPYALPGTFTSPEFYKAKRQDSDCRRIIENTITNEIIIDGTTAVKADNNGLHGDRYGLMKSLISVLNPKCTVVMPDITTLSADVMEASCLYEGFIDKEIDLEFTDSPWLNTSTIGLLLKVNPLEAKQAALSNMVKTLEWKTQKDRSDLINDDPSVTQAPQKLKKTSFEDIE